jgi:hypothetical protein
MDKLSITIDPEQWGDLVTKYQPHSPRLDQTDFTAGTVNLDTDTNGSLAKRKGGVNYNGTPLATPIKDQYEAIFSDGTRHLLVVANGEIRYSSGDTVFNTIVNGTGYSTGGNFEFATTQDRVYGGNAINSPIVYDRVTNYGGATYTAPRIKTMGVAAPVSAPTGSIAAGGAVPVGGHTYKITFVYYDSEESNGSPASALLTTTAGNQTVNLTIPVGSYGVTQRIIYRDNNDSNWVMVGSVTNNTATAFADVLAVGVTPTPIPDLQSAPPSFGLIKLWLDRLWLAQVPGDPNTLFYSDASLPDIYSPENQVLCNPEDPITALAVYFDRLIIFNRRSMGQIVGETPEAFRYAAIPSSVGCVDHRTLQTHVLKGVPVLIWLSERGFYTYDGNAIDYISDPIEDLVNYNIRQALQQKNSNAQTTFTGGTASNGIDLTQTGFSLINRGYEEGTPSIGNNPRRTWNDITDWEDASYRSGIQTKKDNSISPVPVYNPAFLSGQNFGLQVATNDMRLATTVAYTGETSASMGADYIDTRVIIPPVDGMSKIAVAFIPSRDGSIVSVSMRLGSYYNGSGLQARGTTVHYRIETDAGNAPSGTTVGSSSAGTTSMDFSYYVSFPSPIHLTGGQKYWIVAHSNIYGGFKQGSRLSGNKTLVKQKLNNFGSETAWQNPDNVDPRCSFTFNYDKFAASGYWESAIYDSYCDTFDPARQFRIIWQGGSNDPLFTVAKTYFSLYGSNDATFTSYTTVDSGEYIVFNNPQLIANGNFRYWKLRVTLTTTDNAFTDFVTSTPVYFRNTPDDAWWVSNTIDTTSDSTVYNSLTNIASIPGGTLTITIATSASASGPWSGTGNADGQFGPFGSHIVRRYVRINVFPRSNTAQTTAPSVSNLEMKWTVVSNYVSPIIDTAVVPPAGWDVFLSQFTLNGGTVQFQMRSASTTGGIPSATFYTVVPGEFPTSSVVPLQYVQWKAILTSQDLQVPVVDSVTVQWFIAIASSIRPASIFDNGRYYIALAELTQTSNNLVLQLDLNGKWRRFSNMQIATMSFFFNRPYIGLADAGQIRKFLEGYMDGVANIPLDVRTKALDFNSKYQDISEKKKIVGELYVHAKNTGAALQFFYSIDDGATFFPFYTLDGLTSYQTTTAGDDFWIRLKPDWTAGNPIAGSHIMYRIYNNDQYQVEIHALKMQVMVRKQPPVITG